MSNAENRPAGDARTAPVAVWAVLEKLKGQDLIDWRKAPVDGRASIAERNLDIGFPFGWYPVDLSVDLEVGEVKPLRYFSKDLAMWRGEDGQVRIIDETPGGTYTPVRFGQAIVWTCRDESRGAAEQFSEFFKSPRIQKLLLKYGFEPATAS